MADRIAKLIAAYHRTPRAPGDDWSVQPAGAADLQIVRRSAEKWLGIELADDYFRLAAAADRLGADGTYIFSVKPYPYPMLSEFSEEPEIVNENLAQRATGLFAPEEDFVFYGIGDLDFLVQKLSTKRFQIRARDSWDTVLFDHASLAEILFEAFKYKLNLVSE